MMRGRKPSGSLSSPLGGWGWGLGVGVGVDMGRPGGSREGGQWPIPLHLWGERGGGGRRGPRRRIIRGMVEAETASGPKVGWDPPLARQRPLGSCGHSGVTAQPTSPGMVPVGAGTRVTQGRSEGQGRRAAGRRLAGGGRCTAVGGGGA